MKKNILDKAALVISLLFNPALVATVTMIIIAWHYSGMYQRTWLWAILGIVLLVGPATLYVLAAYKFGSVDDIRLSQRQERLYPFLLALTGAIIGTMIIFNRNAPLTVIAIGYILVAELAFIIAVTYFWKISIHMVTLASVLTILIYLIGNKWLLFLYLLVAAVAWARIYRKRHTVLQVVIGGLCGAIIAMEIFNLLNYSLH